MHIVSAVDSLALYTVRLLYRLQMILACYKEFEERVGVMDNTGVKSSSYDIVKSFVDNKLGKFTAADVLANCPNVGRTSAYNLCKEKYRIILSSTE